MTDMPKNTWPGWETVRMIGRGSFGAVYEIQRNMLGSVEKAALKVISIPQNDSDIEEMYSEGHNEESITNTFRSYLKSIIGEYDLMRKLNGNTNIVSCDDVRYIQHDNGIGWTVYIKMELLTPLLKALPANIPEAAVLKLGEDLCAALMLCKKHDIVHRDIKPQNIFISPNGDYKLGDFGIAKTVEKTTGGTKIGTYKYMAPEVYNNQPYGSSADIYSLGLVLYWLLNERRMPFLPLPPQTLGVGMDEQARMRRLSGEPLPAPAHGSDALKAIVLKACAFDPRNRYQSAAEMLDALNNLRKPKQPEAASAVTAPIYPYPTAPSYQDELTLGIWDSANRAAPVNRSAAAVAENAPNPPVAVPAHPSALNRQDDGTVGLWHNGAVAPQPMTPQQPQRSVPITGNVRPQPTPTGTGSGIVPPQQKSTPVQAPPPAKKKSLLPVILLSAAAVVIVLLVLLKPWQATGSSQGGTGTWSGWAYSLPSHVTPQDYIIESRNIMTTTSEKSSLPGWTLYETGTGTGEYGAWSEWSVNPVTASDNRQVQTATWYQYQDIHYTEETVWDTPGDWVLQRESTNDLKKEETATIYSYFYYLCPNCGAHMHGWGPCAVKYGGCGTGYIPQDAYYLHWYDIPYDSVDLKPFYDAHYNDHVYYYTEAIKGIVYFQSTQGAKQGYRYTTGRIEKTEQLSDWSAPTAMQPAASPTRNIREVTMYSYCERTDAALYYYYCWEDAATAQTLSSASNIQRAAVYRYKQK